MTMLKKFKQAALKSLKSAGVSNLVHNSRWRRQRLLILAYHGIALSDEHLFNGSQFISADLFRDRLKRLAVEIGKTVIKRYRHRPVGQVIRVEPLNGFAER